MTIGGLLIALVASLINIGLVAMMFTVSTPANAATPHDTPPCPQLTRLQQRLIEKAASGSDDLRRYIFITRGIYGLDYFETVEWLDTVRSRFALCRPA